MLSSLTAVEWIGPSGVGEELLFEDDVHPAMVVARVVPAAVRSSLRSTI
jgi:hypothetical protein